MKDKNGELSKYAGVMKVRIRWMKGERKWVNVPGGNSLLKVKTNNREAAWIRQLHNSEIICTLLVKNHQYEWDKRPSSWSNDAAQLGGITGLHQQTLTIWWCSDDRACVISLSQISESTFIIHCDKLTRKMSVKFYTYMNFCVRSPSVHLFLCLAIAEGSFLRGRFTDFVSRPSDTSPFALVNLLINFGCSP